MARRSVQEAVILAAGEGTRLRPLTYNRPKVLIPIINRPFLQHQLDLLASVGIKRITIIVGYMKEVLEDWLEHAIDIDMEVGTLLQKTARGTGDAINTARGAVDGPFLVMNGDVLLDRKSLADMVGACCTSVAAKRVENPQDYGVFKVKDGYVEEVVEKAEKPPSNLANVGSYVFEPDIFTRIDRTAPNPKRNEIEITDTLQGMIDSGLRIRCHLVNEWHELGKPWDVLNLNELFLQRAPQSTHSGSRIRGVTDDSVSVGENTVIDEDAKVVGPSIIGSNCRIEGNALVGPFCSVGDRSILDRCRVEGSVIMEECKIARKARIGYSILGPGSSIGVGVSILDRIAGHCSIDLKIKGRLAHSGRVRLGAILGDECVIGDYAMIHPGVMLDPRSDVAAKSLIDGDMST